MYIYREKLGLGEKKFYAGEPWFTQIKTGQKTIDVRTGESFSDLVGKTVTYYYKKEEVEVKILSAKCYDSLEDLVTAEKYKNIGPHLGSNKELITILKQYFSDERIKKAKGVYALKLELV